MSRAFALGGAAAVVGILVLASCQNPFTSDYEDRVAQVDSIAVPDTASAIQPFRVTIGTVVPNVCWQQGHDVVEPASGGVLVTPYDRAYTGKGACAQTLVYFQHQISLRPSGSRGAFTISVKTRLRSVSGSDSIATLTRSVFLE
jgi:hypothetical protein